MEFCDFSLDFRWNFVIPIFLNQNLYKAVDKIAQL